MKIEVTKHTGIDEFQRCLQSTTGLWDKTPRMTLRDCYRCMHSPIRSQIFSIQMRDIPSFVSTHFVRHKVGVEHFVKSLRVDRGGRGSEDRWSLVDHRMVCNAEALINMSHKRLCHQSSKETIKVMKAIKNEIEKVDPVLSEFLVPMCEFRNSCYDLNSCSYYESNYG